jgi:tetratricopeptide (TPR) repeat protein
MGVRVDPQRSTGPGTTRRRGNSSRASASNSRTPPVQPPSTSPTVFDQNRLIMNSNNKPVSSQIAKDDNCFLSPLHGLHTSTVGLADLQVPEKAQREYEDGCNALRKNKMTEAETRMRMLLRIGVFVALADHDRRKADTRLSELRRLAANTPDETLVSCLYYYGTNQAPLAVTACERYVSGNPVQPTAYSNYGWAALDANQFDLALKQFSKAVSLYKDQKPTAVQEIDLGWGMIIAKYYSGERRSAIELFQQLEKDYPSATTAEGVQRLPLIWSDTSLTRIQFIERAARSAVP